MIDNNNNNIKDKRNSKIIIHHKKPLKNKNRSMCKMYNQTLNLSASLLCIMGTNECVLFKGTLSKLTNQITKNKVLHHLLLEQLYF